MTQDKASVIELEKSHLDALILLLRDVPYTPELLEVVKALTALRAGDTLVLNLIAIDKCR